MYKNLQWYCRLIDQNHSLSLSSTGEKIGALLQRHILALSVTLCGAARHCLECPGSRVSFRGGQGGARPPLVYSRPPLIEVAVVLFLRSNPFLAPFL